MRHRSVILALVLGAATAVVDAGPADAGCVSSVVVEGRLLFGYSDIASRHLPDVAKEHRAVEPACNDAGQDDPDRPTSVLTLDGLPGDIAAVQRGTPTRLYVAGGSLVVASAHPLHRVLNRPGSRTSERRGRCRREPRAVRGTLTQSAPLVSTLTLRSGRRQIVVRADRRTRLTNRPPYKPLTSGQPLVLRTSICGSIRLADTIAFDGATVPREVYETDTGGGVALDPRWLAVIAFLAVMVALLAAIRRLGRDPR